LRYEENEGGETPVRVTYLKLGIFLLSAAINVCAVSLIKIPVNSGENKEPMRVRLLESPKVVPAQNLKAREEKVERLKPAKKPESKPYHTLDKKQPISARRQAIFEPQTEETKEPGAKYELGDDAWQGGGEGERTRGANGDTEANPPPPQEKPTAPTEDEINKALDDYRRTIYALIERNKEYPQVARRLGHKGKVKVSFGLLRSGEIISVNVSKSSGFSELDEAAQNAVRKVGKFPPFPEIIEESQKSFAVTIVFELKED